MGWNAWTAISNIGDKIGVGLSTVATGYLKATELIPGVDYSDNETIQSIYTNSERMTDPISKVADPLVEWTMETGLPGAGEIVAYAAIVPTTAIRYGGEAVGLIDEDSEFSKNNDRRIDNVIGYGNYVVHEPLDALGQAGQGLTNAVTTTAGLVVDVGRGAINYSDDAIVGLYNLGIENPDEKADDWYHPLGDREGQFFGVMDWAKEAGTFMPAISNKITNENGELVDNPYAQYQRLTRYTFQGVGEVGAMVLTGGTIGAAWGAARGTKVATTVVRAGDEIAEVAAKTTARATQEATEAAVKVADDIAEEAAEATIKAADDVLEETAEATAKATTAETTVKATATSAERTTEATASMRGSANAANEVAEETVTLTVNGPSQTVTTNVANTLDNAAVEITDTAAKQTVVETSTKAANEAAEEIIETTTKFADDIAEETAEATARASGEAAETAAQATDDVAQAAAEEMVRVRGVEGAQQGFVNGMKFMDPRASKGAAAAEVAGVTATIYLETKADQDAADNVTNKNNNAVDSFVDELEGDADMYNDDQASHLPENISNQFPQSEPQSAMNTEFTNRANATQQPLESVNGKPIFTIAMNQDDAVKFTSSLKV